MGTSQSFFWSGVTCMIGEVGNYGGYLTDDRPVTQASWWRLNCLLLQPTIVCVLPHQNSLLPLAALSNSKRFPIRQPLTMTKKNGAYCKLCTIIILSMDSAFLGPSSVRFRRPSSTSAARIGLSIGKGYYGTPISLALVHGYNQDCPQ